MIDNDGSPAASCIVVAFHKPDCLRELLSTVLLTPDIEVIIVNVEDDSNILELIRTYDVKMVAYPSNLGYAAAVNAGVRVATAPVIVFMNDDVIITGDTVLCLGAIVASGSADVAVPQVRDRDGCVERTIMALPTPVAIAREWMLLPDQPLPVLRHLISVEKWRHPTERESVLAATASIVATSAALLRESPLPELYFLYWEESDWFFTLNRKGKRVVYEPSLEAQHLGGRDDLRPAKSALLARNAVRCVRRTQGRSSALVTWMIVVVWNARLCLVDLIRHLSHRRSWDVVASRWAGVRSAVLALREVP